MRCCCSENFGAALSSPGAIVMPVPPSLGSQYANVVCPTRTRSPSASRRRPWMRRPLTKVPFWENPSSQSSHSPALDSSSAWSRDTSGSHGKDTSASTRRPSVIEPAVASSATIRWLPRSSRKTRNGAPRCSASRRAARSSGVARSSARGVSIMGGSGVARRLGSGRAATYARPEGSLRTRSGGRTPSEARTRVLPAAARAASIVATALGEPAGRHALAHAFHSRVRRAPPDAHPRRARPRFPRSAPG